MIIPFLTFWGTIILSSMATSPFYIPVSSAQTFQFLYILTNTCYFLLKNIFFLLKPSYGGMKWCLFAVPLWLVLLSIFTCVYWPFIYLLWEISIHIICPLLNQAVCIFYAGLYFFLKCMICKPFPQFCRLTFHSVYSSLCCTNGFNFDGVQFVYFFLLMTVLWRHIQEIIAKSNVMKLFPYVFFSEFYSFSSYI